MRKVIVGLALLLALVALGLALRGVLHVDLRPRAPRFVDDQAKLLGPFGVLVEQQCVALAADLGIEVRVATRRGAGNEKIAEFAERLFRELRVGKDSPTGGILILLEANAGQARLEVSYSLEGVLPDAIVSQITRDQLVPYASHRAAGMAVMDAMHFLRDRLLDAVAHGNLVLVASLENDHLSQILASHSGGAGAQAQVPKLPSHEEFKRRVPDERRALYAPSEDPRESAEAFRRVQRDMVGDPTLALFSAGSRVMRERYPTAPYEELVRAESTQRSLPLELEVRGERAFLGSTHPARGFVPILLVREEGLWRVDLVETFKSFFFDNEGAYVFVNRASPYAQFVPGGNPPSDQDLSPLELGGESLEAALQRLERSRSAADRFQLAELLMRNTWVTAEAIPLYAEAAALAPKDPQIVLTYADRASYLFMPIIAVDAVAGLGPDYWTRVGWLYESASEPELARTYYAKALDHDPHDEYAGTALARLGAPAN